jgi:hypothetical protein
LLLWTGIRRPIKETAAHRGTSLRLALLLTLALGELILLALTRAWILTLSGLTLALLTLALLALATLLTLTLLLSWLLLARLLPALPLIRLLRTSLVLTLLLLSFLVLLRPRLLLLVCLGKLPLGTIALAFAALLSSLPRFPSP